MRGLTREQKIFLKVTRAYVGEERPDMSFRFSFDGVPQPIIGSGSRIVDVSFHNAERLFQRIFLEGNMGLGEGYSEGLIEVKDEDYKEFLCICVYATSPRILRQLAIFDMIAVVRARAGGYFTKPRQNATIDNHYSLSDWFDNDDDSNTFFHYWLDRDHHMYSCGKWDPETKTLQESETNKLEFYAKRMGIDESSQGKTLLDLGCGWGGVLFFMAEKFGVCSKGLTLSTAQHSFITKEIARRRLQDLVSVELRNVHDMKGRYDYIISIGMLEHITDFDDLYEKTARALNPDGQALMHSIYSESWFYKADRWFLKYIFPYGSCPYFPSNLRCFKKHFKFVEPKKMPDLSYPKTLDAWFANFCKAEPQIRDLLQKSSKVKDVEFAIKTFKHYLAIASVSLTFSGFVGHTLVREPRVHS
ncbi:MAG: class I SAM-dependent methyltransferase [Nitrospirae bacterium]|nr:class I SAM-dependent methyltransferase [Nitrospirota bacterium]